MDYMLLRLDRHFGTLACPGLAGNRCVVSETFAQTGKVFFICGLCLSEVKAALHLGARYAPGMRVINVT